MGLWINLLKRWDFCQRERETGHVKFASTTDSQKRGARVRHTSNVATRHILRLLTPLFLYTLSPPFYSLCKTTKRYTWWFRKDKQSVWDRGRSRASQFKDHGRQKHSVSVPWWAASCQATSRTCQLTRFFTYCFAAFLQFVMLEGIDHWCACGR